MAPKRPLGLGKASKAKKAKKEQEPVPENNVESKQEEQQISEGRFRR